MRNKNYSLNTARLYALAAMLLLTMGLFAQSVEKTFVRSFNIQGAHEVFFAIEAPVEVETWSQNTIRIQMNVSLDRGTESMFRSLVQAGRYNLKGKLEADQYVVTAPGIEREIRLNGQPLVENYSFTIFVPQGVHIDLLDRATTALF